METFFEEKSSPQALALSTHIIYAILHAAIYFTKIVSGRSCIRVLISLFTMHLHSVGMSATSGMYITYLLSSLSSQFTKFLASGEIFPMERIKRDTNSFDILVCMKTF